MCGFVETPLNVYLCVGGSLGLDDGCVNCCTTLRYISSALSFCSSKERIFLSILSTSPLNSCAQRSASAFETGRVPDDDNMSLFSCRPLVKGLSLTASSAALAASSNVCCTYNIPLRPCCAAQWACKTRSLWI